MVKYLLIYWFADFSPNKDVIITCNTITWLIHLCAILYTWKDHNRYDGKIVTSIIFLIDRYSDFINFKKNFKFLVENYG